MSLHEDDAATVLLPRLRESKTAHDVPGADFSASIGTDEKSLPWHGYSINPMARMIALAFAQGFLPHLRIHLGQFGAALHQA
jgi:hypothetical protein